MAALVSLTALDVAGNKLTGSLPTAWSSLTALARLDVSGNLLTGSLPVGLGGLSALTEFGFCGNGFSGPLPAGLDSGVILTDYVPAAGVEGCRRGVALRVSPGGLEEGESGEVTVTAELVGFGGAGEPGRPGLDTAVSASAAGGTAGTGDFRGEGTGGAVDDFTITIPAGAAVGTGSFQLEALDDALFEGSESMILSGSSAGLLVFGEELYILDGDSKVNLSVSPGFVVEGAAAEITVTMSSGSLSG